MPSIPAVPEQFRKPAPLGREQDENQVAASLRVMQSVRLENTQLRIA